MLAKNTGQKLYYHRVGEAQSKDQLILERPDHPQWGITATVSDDGEYVSHLCVRRDESEQPHLLH